MKLRHACQGVYSAMVIVLATIAEAATPPSNPCTPQWVPCGWDIGPTIDMTAPPGPVKLGFSPSGVHVVVHADEIPPTAGQVAYYDAVPCPEPGSRPDVWITPETTIQWTVYMAPEGTSQVIGYGETADFIVYHAKFFEIHWKIIGHIDPTGINLAWDDEVVAPHHTRIYVRPEIIQPRGDPPNDNHYTFSFTPGSAWPNGRCTIHPRGLGADPDPWWLTWTYPAIPGCVKSQDLGVSPYDYPYLYYDRLPNSSGSFGNKTLTLTQNPAGCSHSRTIQLFFDANDAAVNHPGTGTGATPNWYFYWKHTTASWGDPIYATSPAPGITEDDWAWTTWSTTHQAYKAFLWHRSNDLSIPPAGPYRGTNYLGIDTFGFACRHEACHVFWNTSWWPNGPDTGQGGVGVWPTNPEDKDGDLLPDYLEPTLGSSVGGPFYTNQVDSNFDGVDDAEAYTYFKQNLWKTNSAKAQDWSNPGQQSNE